MEDSTECGLQMLEDEVHPLCSISLYLACEARKPVQPKPLETFASSKNKISELLFPDVTSPLKQQRFVVCRYGFRGFRLEC